MGIHAGGGWCMQHTGRQLVVGCSRHGRRSEVAKLIKLQKVRCFHMESEV